MDHSYFFELIFLLAISVVTVWAFKRLKLPAILAYLVAGIIAGPQILAIITDPHQVALVGELGIVFLLFSLGLEFSIPKLVAMRHLVFGVGSAQVVLTLIIVMLITNLLGLSWSSAFIVGSIFALSSTAVVVKSLNETGITQTKRGQIAISILLFQDIAVVPLLIAIPLMAGGDSGGQLMSTIVLALTKGFLVVVILLSVGKWVLPRVFNEIAQVRTDELFVLTAILVTILAGILTSSFGLSMALGAFLSGMMLSESQYKHQLEADIRPFKDILMGLFFISVGMSLDIVAVAETWPWVLLSVLALLVIKSHVVAMLAVMAKENIRDGWGAGLMLFQMGEFGFVLVALAQQFELLSPTLGSTLIGVGVVSMAITPFVIDHHGSLIAKIESKLGQNLEDFSQQSDVFESKLTDHVVVCGFGRVGQTVSRFLKEEHVDYIALDVDPVRVKEAQAAGENVHYGHARDKAILESANVKSAKLVVITFSDITRTHRVIKNVKDTGSQARIMVRTKDDHDLQKILDDGADQVVPEALEGSLMLVSQVLFESGVPMSKVLKRLHKERENRYGKMHGFVPGDVTQMSAERRNSLEFIHGVALPVEGYAVGKQLNSLTVDRFNVQIIGIRRQEKTLEPLEENTQVEAYDVLILKGKPINVEKAERYLMAGNL